MIEQNGMDIILNANFNAGKVEGRCASATRGSAVWLEHVQNKNQLLYANPLFLSIVALSKPREELFLIFQN